MKTNDIPAQDPKSEESAVKETIIEQLSILMINYNSNTAEVAIADLKEAAKKMSAEEIQKAYAFYFNY
jgi:glutamyl-tRNA reductase